VLLSIGGPGSAETFPFAASTAARRDTFARTAREMVDASGFDGIDGGFEPSV
jgi:chitinase